MVEVNLASQAVRQVPVSLSTASDDADVVRGGVWLGAGRLAHYGAAGFTLPDDEFVRVLAGVNVVNVRTNIVHAIEPDATHASPSRLSRISGDS